MLLIVLEFSKFPILVYQLYNLTTDEIKIIEGEKNEK